MRRLLVLTSVAIAAGFAGCSCGPRRNVATPICRPACVPTPACGPTLEPYAPAGTIMTAPTLAVPQGAPMQVVPGPSTYTPAP